MRLSTMIIALLIVTLCAPDPDTGKIPIFKIVEDL